MQASPSSNHLHSPLFSYQPPAESRFSPAEGNRPPKGAASRSRATEREQSKPRALVVDDAVDVTEMIALFLQHAGYESVMAFNAMEALDAARGAQFDIIVSDIGMPGMSGYELAVALRELPSYRTIPMIAVTGFSMYDDRSRALESGFNAHLTKPINPMALLELIKSLRD